METPTETTSNAVNTEPGSSAPAANPQPGSSAPPTTDPQKPDSPDSPDVDTLKAQLEEAQKVISRLQGNNQALLDEKLKEKEARRSKETDFEKLAADYKEENTTLLQKLKALETELEPFRESYAKQFKAAVSKLPESLRARYSDSEKFTLDDVTAVLETLQGVESKPKPSETGKPPANNQTASLASLEAAAATGDYDAINKAIAALRTRK